MKYKGFIVPPIISDFLIGRVWAEDQLPKQWQAIASQVPHYMHLLKKYGYVQQQQGIRQQPKQCMRCLTTLPRHLITYTLTYCRHCLMMGRVTSQTTLLTYHDNQYRFIKKTIAQYPQQLSEAQQRVSQALITSVKARQHHLVDAVCGAGKTEMLFPMLDYALHKRYRICIATPRADVVKELMPRLQQAFPQRVIHALYGDAPLSKGCAQIIIATTHQLYHFENAFDIMIVDEADAFPFTYDYTLQLAVTKAKKQDAPLIFVTATPSKTLLALVKKEQWQHSKVWHRYHQHPLPVPRFSSLFHYQTTLKKRLPRKLARWVQERLQCCEPFLIFFATKQLMASSLIHFQQLDPLIESVHAHDSERTHKVQQLRDGQVKGLLTTTILERGITIPNIQIAVVGAEHTIFDASALIQISGRAGRHPQYPTGDIVFFHHGISVAMSKARQRIRMQNAYKEV